MEISQDLNHRPIIFIRFNPDGYTTEDGKKITTPWKANNLGIQQIMNTRKKEWTERLTVLFNTIDIYLKNELEKTVEIIQLFY